MNTVTMVGQICGTTTRTKTWLSLAPSIRAASRVSAGTPFTAAESSTIAKPTRAQSSMIISSMLLKCSVLSWSQVTGSPPSVVTIAFWIPTCASPSGRNS